MLYLLDLGFTKEELNQLETKLSEEVKEKLTLFPKVVAVNYDTLKKTRIKNHKEALLNHAHLFLTNPDKFSEVFAKYDPDDLVRCLEKNIAVIEKL